MDKADAPAGSGGPGSESALERGHKREYERITALHGKPGKVYPTWEELTEEQRVRIRAENDRFAKEMHQLGQDIAAGKI